MARKAGDFGKELEGILEERQRFERAVRNAVQALNRTLKKIGYQVVPKGGAVPVRRRRRRRKAGARARRRPRGKK